MKIIFTISLILISNILFGQTGNIDELKRLYKENKYSETIDLASKIILELKDSIDKYKKIIGIRTDCYMALQDFKNAINDWNTLIKLDSTNVGYYQGLSYSFWAIGDKDKCLKTIKKAYLIKSNDGWVLSNLAYYNGEFGNFDEGVNYASIGLQLKGLDNIVRASLLNNRGFSYLGLKRYDLALTDINQSITLNSNNSFAYYFRAKANIGLKQMDSICNDLEMAKKLGGINITKDLIEKYCKK